MNSYDPWLLSNQLDPEDPEADKLSDSPLKQFDYAPTEQRKRVFNYLIGIPEEEKTPDSQRSKVSVLSVFLQN